MFDPSINVTESMSNSINHEIIIIEKNNIYANNEIDENKVYLTLKNNFTFNFKSIEEKEKCEFLVKFNGKGNFYIILDAEYKIIKKEILDDFSLMKHAGEINVEVVNAFHPKFE